MKTDRYQIRYAAGCFWALDMEQTGEHLCRPIPLNACGAFLFERYAAGMSVGQLAEELSREYEIPMEQAAEDAEDFCRQMETMKG